MWQRIPWPVSASASGGSVVSQIAPSLRGQRVWKGQPLGGLAALGISPSRRMRLRGGGAGVGTGGSGAPGEGGGGAGERRSGAPNSRVRAVQRRVGVLEDDLQHLLLYARAPRRRRRERLPLERDAGAAVRRGEAEQHSGERGLAAA